MKHLANYLKNNNVFNNIDESLNNNVRMINESQLIIEHGKDIDNLLYKVKVYTNNHLHNRINESQNNYNLSLSEQIAVRDLFIYCLEDYKESLLNECSVYENLLNDTISINEAEFQLGSVVKNLWNQGKDKVEKIYNDAKTKIQEINELIKAFAEKSIKSLKEFANKIVETLDKLGDSLFKIANKIGFDKDKVIEISDELIEDIKNNPEKITKNDIFESLGKDINEGIVDWVQNSKAGKWYAEKKQKPLWNAFFQFCNWLLVCKVLPAVILAIFPGSILYYIVSIAIKVIWNIKKIKGLIKQTQDYIHSWNTMTNWQRIWKAAVLLFMWYLWFNNVKSIAGNASKVGDALKKSLEDGEFWKQMFGKAHTGIEPDKLEAMGAAVIRWIGKGFEGSISDAYNEIMDACKDSMGVEAYEAAKKAIEESKAAAEAAKKTMENTESLTKQIEDEVKNFKGDVSTNLLKKIKALCTLSPDELKDKLTYRVWVDGTATTKAAWLKKLIEEAKAAGMDDSIIQKTQDMMNDSLHKVNANAGSVSFMELPGEMIKFAAGKNLLGHNKWFGIIGEIAKEVKDAGGDLPPLVPAFSAAMSSDVPIITFKQKGNGFRVRLGDEKSKNYIYEVGKDDVKFIKPSEIDNDKVKKSYEKIKEVINTENKKFIDKILNSDLKEDEKKKIKKRVEEFNDSYSNELSKTPLVVIYGSQIDKETQNKYDGKESLKSLHDYIINEGFNVDSLNTYIDIIVSFVTLTCKTYNVTNLNDIKSDKLEGKLKDFYDQNISGLISKLKDIQKYLDDNNIKWVTVDGKLSLDFGESKPEDHKKLAVLMHSDKIFGGDKEKNEKELEDIFNTLKNTAENVEQTYNNDDLNIFTKMFNGEELSEDDIAKIKDYLDDKFSSLSEKDLEELISKINELSKNVNNEETTNESLEYEKLLILEGITNKNILASLNNICTWLTKKLDNNQRKTNSSELKFDKIKNIFSKDKFKDANLGKDEKRNFATLVYKITGIDYDKAVDLVQSLHKLYTKCSYENKEDNSKNSKENNNDINLEQKLLYNHIIELMSETDFKKEVLDSKNNNIVNKFKISDEEKEDKETINNIKKELEKDKPTDNDNKDKSTEEIIQDITNNDKESNSSKSNLLELYKIIISLLKKDQHFKDDVKDNQYKLLPGVSIEESFKSLQSYIISEGSELTKKDFKTNLKELKDYLLKKINSLVKKDKGELDKPKSGEIQKSGEKHEVMPLQPSDIVKSMGATYKPEEAKKDDNVITGDIPQNEPIKELPSSKKTEDDQKKDSDQKEDTKKEDTKEEDNTGHQPVLIFSNVYGMDIANANEKGPRKEIYSLKGAFHSLQFIEIKKGMNLHDIQEMLGEWMYTMVNNLCNVAVISPFEKKKSWWKDKFIPSKNLKENEERREFGNLTNGEIADIMNKKENAKNYVLSKTNSISIIQDESDKKYEEDKKKEYNEKLKNADEETIKAVKEIDPDAVGEDGKIKPEKIEDISKKASSYKLAQYKSKNTKKGGGFWSKLKNFVKGIFGGNKKEGKNYNKLLNHIDPETNEGLNEYDNLDLFLEEMFKRKTLSEYIIERKL